MMIDELERERRAAYIVYCPVCRGMIGAHVDAPGIRVHTAAFVARHICLGYPVERKTVADGREAKWCDCESETKGDGGDDR